MKNRLLFLTVAGALTMPAFAAAPQAEWSLYGTLVSEVYQAQTTGAAQGDAYNYQPRLKFTCATSNLGFKGSMQVASDVKVIWQIETAINQDGDYPGAAGSAGGIGTRNTALGLAGSWGQVLAGQWDTPYKTIQMGLGHIRASIESDVNIINQAGFNTFGTTTATQPLQATKDAAFNRRQGNSVQYWSPVFYGLQAKLLYSINEAKTAASTTAAQANPTIFSGSLSYTNKDLGLTVLYGYEQHNDYYGLAMVNGAYSSKTSAAVATTTAAAAGTSSKDTGHELAVYWVAPTKTRVTAIVEQLKYTTDGVATASVNEYKRTAWFLSANHPITEHHRVWASYGSADKGTMKTAAGVDVTGEFGAKQYNVGYSYMFNKVTELYAFYGGVKNDKDAQYNLMPQVGSGNSVARGADVRTIGLGLFYKF